ncbi:single-stranded-DNA-specific exonuclease [Clostridiales Family XIII bacterium PM5-7]
MKLQPKLLALLHKRGITTEEELTEFLSDKPQKTYDPFLLHNMEAGVDLILSTIEHYGRICIYGDYDADGVTSTALMMDVLGQLTDNLTYYIPSRFSEGYGLNCSALDKIKEDHVDLVITVDCGSVSCDEVQHAKAIGLNILVTDHHTIADKIADCLVINPMQPQCQYPFKHLAGVGVAFKVAQALAAKSELPKEAVNRTLDLVGIGTIGDIVPLIDENRTLAKFGIRAVNVTKRKGLEQLILGIGLQKGNVRSENISYIIVPHLNAAGRMGDASVGVKLLTSSDDGEIAEAVETLISRNHERKKVQNLTFEQCKTVLEEQYQDDLFYVIDLPDAHEGITGIVAGKVKEAYGKPTVVVTPTGEDCLKGTGRSIEGVNIYTLLKNSEALLERFGGHEAACGFTMKKEHLEQLRGNLNREMERLLADNPNLFDQRTQADLFLSGPDVCLELIEEINKLEPFGCDNEQPKIHLDVMPRMMQKMGSEKQFTKFVGILSDGSQLPCVIFNQADQYDELLQKNEKVSIIGALSSQTWNGKTNLQFTVQNVERR